MVWGSSLGSCLMETQWELLYVATGGMNFGSPKLILQDLCNRFGKGRKALCAVTGVRTAYERQVLTVYANRWMVYDRWGHWECSGVLQTISACEKGTLDVGSKTEPSTQRPSATVPVSGRSAGAGLSTSEKLIQPEEEQEVLQWYKQKDTERAKLAEEAKADAGEVDFVSAQHCGPPGQQPRG